MVDEGRGFIPDFLRTILTMNIEEFVILQDSMEIKDTKIFDLCFERWAGVSVSLSSTPAPFGSTHGKFIRSILLECDIPKISSKREDILYEVSFAEEYRRKCNGVEVLMCDLPHSDKFEEKFGRKNMVVENDWIKKYKGTWHPSMAV